MTADYDAEAHEAGIIDRLIIRERRARYRQLIGNPKKREKFTSQIGHFREFDPRFQIEIATEKQYPKEIEELLTKLGAPLRCYVISDSSEDGNFFPLPEILEEVIMSTTSAIISCIPGKLAYYEGEDERLILHRP